MTHKQALPGTPSNVHQIADEENVLELNVEETALNSGWNGFW